MAKSTGTNTSGRAWAPPRLGAAEAPPPPPRLPRGVGGDVGLALRPELLIQELHDEELHALQPFVLARGDHRPDDAHKLHRPPITRGPNPVVPPPFPPP